MKALVRWTIALGILGAVAFWFVTAPSKFDDSDLVGLTADPDAGEQVFLAAGCSSCHSAPGSEGEVKLTLAGGKSFPSPFGTFIAPNISSDPDTGIGSWSARQLADAVIHGTSPTGQHYYPAFPYGSYSKMTLADAVNLHAYLGTLPQAPDASKPHDIGFPFNIRLSLGGWKFLFLDSDWIVTGDLSAEEERGRYLVEALGHCGECHTPRNALGGLQTGSWLAGAANPSGTGKIPNITPAALEWSTADIAEYLSSGFTPDFDTAGGHMADVVENTSKLPAEDRMAIAAYLKKVAPVQ